jgi:hypothetical protein
MDQETTEQIASISRLLAARLRIEPGALSAASAQERQRLLAEEIERALADQVPAKRRALLQDLQQRLPTWDAETARTTPLPEDEPVGAPPATASATRLAESLIAAYAEADPDERDRVWTVLARAGLGPDGAVRLGEDVLASVREAAGMPEGSALEPERAGVIAAELVAFARRLDGLLQTTWRELSAGGGGSAAGGVAAGELPREPLDRQIAGYLAGGEAVSRAQVTARLEAVRGLAGALIAAIGGLNHELADRLHARLSPSKIEQLARQDKRWHEIGTEPACWRRYRDVAATLDEAELEQEIKRIITDNATRYRRGTV